MTTETPQAVSDGGPLKVGPLLRIAESQDAPLPARLSGLLRPLRSSPTASKSLGACRSVDLAATFFGFVKVLRANEPTLYRPK